MSENKFIAKMRGEKAPKSIVEIKNDGLFTPFVDLPNSTTVSNGFENEAGHSIVVAKSAQNWALQKSGIEPMVGVDTAEYSGQVAVKYDGLWVNSSYTFPLSGNEANPVVAIINPCAKWVLNFVGKDLFSDKDSIDFTLVVKIGSTHISNRDFSVRRQAGFFCQKFVIDFSESEQELIKVNGGEKLTVQLLCGDDMATAVYYTGLSVLTLLQRKIDGDTVASDTKTFNEVVEDIDDIRKDIDERFFGVYKFKGTVPTVADLPATGNTIGDTYNIAETGSNYAWDGQNWDKLSETLDLTPYQKIENLSQELDNDTTKYPSNKAVKEAVDKKDSYPEQIGHEGEFLQTNGDKTSWAKPLPAQKDNAGKFLATDGKNAKWEKLLPEQSGNSGKFLKTNGTEAEWESIRQLPAPEGNNAKVLMNKDGQAYWDYIPSAVPLLFTVWSDHVINDVSWLRADTFSWQSGDVYKSVYDHLVDDWNNATSVSETVNGHTFNVMVAEDGHKLFSMNGHDLAQTLYDETGVAWYYILDQENKRFKLPRTKWSFVGLRDSVGRYIPAGLPNITGSQQISSDIGFASSVADQGSAIYSKQATIAKYYSSASSSASRTVALAIDASRSSSVYGGSNTVQQRATQMYLYFYVGNYTKDQYTVDIGKVSELINDFDFETSRKQINDVKDAAIAEIDTKEQSSLQNITDTTNDSVSRLESMGNALNHTNISNCVTKIPQDIKLELADGTLILKAGSTYYTPNGVDTYTKTTTTADKRLTNANNAQWAVFVNQAGNLQVWNTSALYSGTTAPSGVSYPMWWDTTNNIIKISNDSGETWVQQFSLPLCIITVSNGAISSIDQVFNGLGYIGSTVFVLPGVKCLIPNGRNEDGTLKNITYTTSTIQIRTNTNTYTKTPIILTSSGTIVETNDPVIYSQYLPTPGTTYERCYVISENQWYAHTANANWAKSFLVVLGYQKRSSGTISNFEPRPAFHAVDYSDFKPVQDHSVIAFQKPTSSNGYTWYRKYADGWVEQGGISKSQTVSAGNSSTQTITLPIGMLDTSYSIQMCGTQGAWAQRWATSITNTSFVMNQGNRSGSGSNTQQTLWEVRGMYA